MDDPIAADPMKQQNPAVLMGVIVGQHDHQCRGRRAEEDAMWPQEHNTRRVHEEPAPVKASSRIAAAEASAAVSWGDAVSRPVGLGGATLTLCARESSAWGPTAELCVDAFFFSSRRRHTRCLSDWSSDVCSSD